MSVTEAIEPSTNFDVERAEHLARIVDGHDSSQMNRVYQTGRFDHLTLEGEKAPTKVPCRNWKHSAKFWNSIFNKF